MEQHEVDALVDLAAVAAPNNPGTSTTPEYLWPQQSQHVDDSSDEEGILLAKKYGRDDREARLELSALSKRDSQAVAYTTSLLAEGDTLVFIKYPGGKPVYHSTGFKLNQTHIVHSEKLLATGSLYFQRALLDPQQQRRVKKRLRLFDGLPTGVKYVLDLTPPEEGDEAVNLTTELSCSRGIRFWYTSEIRCGISSRLVGGKDETTDPESGAVTGRVTPPEAPKSPRIPIRKSPRAFAVSSVMGGENSSEAMQRVLDQTRNEKSEGFDLGNATKYDNLLGERTMDYCPIRHRVGIERLLQIIEGKEPYLDSAVKVWTLASLAKFFQCPSNVVGSLFPELSPTRRTNFAQVDYVLTWTIAEPNCQIMEILPEIVLRMGYALENSKLTRSAFAILVSEEAFRIASSKPSSLARGSSMHTHESTLFGRPLEALDEDLVNAIQHAGRSFAEKIEATVEDLMDPKMRWLEQLPDFAVLDKFDRFLEDNKHLLKNEFEDAKDSVMNLKSLLIDFVRGRILWCALQPLNEVQAKDGLNHRFAENYIAPPATEFRDIYDGFTEHERYVTRFFWQNVNYLDWSQNGCQSNLLYDKFLRKRFPFEQQQIKFAKMHGIKGVFMDEIERAAFWYHRVVRNATHTVRTMREGLGLSPSEALPTVSSRKPSVTKINNDLEKFSLSDLSDKAESFWSEFDEVTSQGDTHPLLEKTPPVSDPDPRLFSDPQPSGALEYFHHHINISSLFINIEKQLSMLCYKMTSKGEQDWSTLCDTLLCLDENEYKYLPLWAGGMDDGSGGVFEEMIPPANKGPIGPGPSYHTGSTLNSTASSEMDFDGDTGSWTSGGLDTEYLHTSLAVGDGHSDHIDRRYVASEEDFPMEDAVTTAAGPSTDHALPLRFASSSAPAPAQPQAQPQSQASEKVGINDDEFMNVADEDEELDFNSDDDWDDGSLTDRE
jgi:hypothetical protein